MGSKSYHGKRTVPRESPVPSHVDLTCGELVGSSSRRTFRFCNDGSACGRRPSLFVRVAGITLASCGHHKNDAREKAADLADVDLSNRSAPVRAGGSGFPSDPFDRRPEDYDVSDHPAYVPPESEDR